MTLDRRRFMERAARAGLGLGAATTLARLPLRAFAAPTKNKPLKLCMVSGSEEYKSNESLAAFQELLEKKFPIKCSRAFWKSKTELPGLDALASCDVMLVFTKRLEPPSDQLKLIQKYCLAGRPIVGLRTASPPVQKRLPFGSFFFGGDFPTPYW